MEPDKWEECMLHTVFRVLVQLRGKLFTVNSIHWQRTRARSKLPTSVEKFGAFLGAFEL